VRFDKPESGEILAILSGKEANVAGYWTIVQQNRLLIICDVCNITLTAQHFTAGIFTGSNTPAHSLVSEARRSKCENIT
jgi:hypothetical protein